MKRYQKVLSVVFIVLIGFSVGGYYFWKQGQKFREPFWSPNGQYYVQRYVVVTPKGLLPGMPGNGSDNLEGYVRLFDKDGVCLNEVFISYIAREMDVFWYENKVYPVSELDDEPWILPTNAE